MIQHILIGYDLAREHLEKYGKLFGNKIGENKEINGLYTTGNKDNE